MQAFVAVGETGSFTTAAAKLGVARALVSKRVAMLERTMEVRLLNRTTRRVGLTEAGQAFLGRAQRILAEFERASAELANLHGEPAGTLKVSAPMSFGIRHLARLLPAFLRSYPTLKIDLALNDRQVDLIEEGVDLAVRIGKLADSSLVARRLARVRMAICAAPAYLARAGQPSSPAELDRHKALLYGQNTASPRWTLTRNGETVVIEPVPQMISNNGDILMAAAIAGEGIVVQPTFIVGDALRSGEMVRILPDYEPPEFNLYAVWPANRLLPAKVRLFVNYLSAQIGDPPDWDRELFDDAPPAVA